MLARCLGSFVQSYGSKWLDGSLLLIPTTGFLPIEDPRIAGTVRAVQGRLLQDGCHAPRSGGSGNRPRARRGRISRLQWLADALILLGRHDEGARLFQRLLNLRSDVGLLYDVCARRLVGNFPQAFSHIALISTAQNLARAGKPAEQRAGRATPGA